MAADRVSLLIYSDSGESRKFSFRFCPISNEQKLAIMDESSPHNGLLQWNMTLSIIFVFWEMSRNHLN